MIRQYLFTPLAIAFIWCGITGRVSLDSILLGYVLGLVTLLFLERLGIRFERLRSLDQVLAAVIYTITIVINALKSSLKVVRLVLSREIVLKTGVIALESGDLSEGQLLTALSAHGINTTPGEIVVDIVDGGLMYVHCLDLAASRAVIKEEQAKRLYLLRRIIGERNHE